MEGVPLHGAWLGPVGSWASILGLLASAWAAIWATRADRAVRRRVEDLRSERVQRAIDRLRHTGGLFARPGYARAHPDFLDGWRGDLAELASDRLLDPGERHSLTGLVSDLRDHVVQTRETGFRRAVDGVNRLLASIASRLQEKREERHGRRR